MATPPFTQFPIPTVDAVTSFIAGADFSNAQVKSTGSTTLRTLADRFSKDFFLDVMDVGGVFDGVTDEQPAIQRGINLLAGLGGGRLILPPRAGLLGSTALVTTDGIKIIGSGPGLESGGGPGVTGTKLTWSGAAAGTMFKFTSINGAGNRKIGSGALSGMTLKGNAGGGAAIGLEVVSHNQGVFDDLTFDVFTSAAIKLYCVQTLAAGNPVDCQLNQIIRCHMYQNFGGNPGHGIVFDDDGISVGDASRNSVKDCEITYGVGHGINCLGCDHNVGDNVQMVSAGGGGAGFNFGIGASGFAAGGNIFTNSWPDAGGVNCAAGTLGNAVYFNQPVFDPITINTLAASATFYFDYWVNFTPALASSGGTITTLSVQKAQWLNAMGRTSIALKFTITTNGTGSGVINCTLPATPGADTILAGWDNTANIPIFGHITAGSRTMTITTGTGAYPGVDGHVYVLGGSFQWT